MPRIEKTLLFLALASLLGVAVSEIHSFDVFWQLQSGRYILDTKSFIYHDIFSLAADAPRFEHCWLHDLVFYGAYALLGYDGISILKGLLILAPSVVLVAVARVRSSSWLAILLLLPVSMLLTRGGWLARPQLWTFLFFALFLLVLERHRAVGDRMVFLLIPLMVLWANFHAGSVLAFPVLAAYLAGEGGAILLKRSSLPKGAYRLLWLVALALPVAALITPYGMETLETLLRAPKFGVASGNIKQIYNMDWKGTTFFANPYFFYTAILAGGLLLLGWRRLSLSDLFLLVGVTLMGLSLARHTTFLYMAMAALIPAYADAAVRPLVSRLHRKVILTLRVTGQVMAIAVIIFFFLPAYRTYGLFNTGLRTWHYPIEAADFVKANRLPANIYNTYDWGGYLMWTLYPDYQVFWDGRSDSVEMFRYGLQVMSGHAGWDRILNRFQVKTVVTKACTVDTGQHYPIIDLLRNSPEWALVFADESSLVFVRRDVVDARWLKGHELPDHRVDDTILSEAALLVGTDAGRYQAYWEMARIYMARKDYGKAFAALERHLMSSPPGSHQPQALQFYRMLEMKMGRKGS